MSARPFQVIATPEVRRSLQNQDASFTKQFDQWLKEVVAHGCAAFGYRMTGASVEHICIRHFGRGMRVAAVFGEDRTITIFAVGPHEQKRPDIDVYRAIYAMAEVEIPPAETRTKPPCCEDGRPPTVDHARVDDLVDRSRSLARKARRHS